MKQQRAIVFVTERYRTTGSDKYVYSIPSTYRYKDDEGLKYARYVRGEHELEKKKQSEAANTRFNSKQDLTFEHGIMYVDASDKFLLEFLRNHPYNKSNSNRIMSEAQDKFYEHNQEEEAQKLNKNDDLLFRAIEMYSKINGEQIQQLARFLGVDMTFDKETIRWEVRRFLKGNPQEFIDLIDNPVLKVHDIVEEAFDLGIIEKTNNAVIWRSGGTIIAVAKGQSHLQELRDFILQTDDGSKVLASLEATLYPENDASTDDVHEVKSKLKELTGAEIFDLAKKEGVIRWSTPFFMMGDNRVGKSKNDLIDRLDTKSEMFDNTFRRGLELALVS